MEIEISSLHTVWTIAFLNTHSGSAFPVVWVCQTKSHYEAALERLKAMPHVRIVQSGPSHVE
jgi:hypothetical protein